MIVLFSYIVISFLSNSQERTYYFYTPSQIEYNRKCGKHERYNIIQIDEKTKMFVIGNVSEFNDLMDITSVYFGKFNQNGDTIVCHDELQRITIKFKTINQFTIKALNTTDLFKKEHRFYVGLSKNYDDNFIYTSYLYTSDLINSQYWSTGLKEGIQSYYMNGKTQLIFYLNGNAKDSIATMNNDSLEYFIYKYHK